MKEDLVSLKTAKLLKEKGFELTTDYFYCDNYKGLCDAGYDGEFLNIEGGVIFDCNGEFEEGARYYAPTQALAQKYLLEKHGIHIQIRRLCYRRSFREEEWDEYNDFIYMPGENEHSNITLGNEFENYEQALENAIYESLKLIKTKKQ